MEQMFYEINENFKPVFDTAMALLLARGHKDICTLISNAEIDVVNTDFDNLNGGTYGYTVYIGVDVKTYASINTENISEVERVISESLNEATRSDERNFFAVSISPKLVNNGFNWDLIGGLASKNKLRQDIETIRNIMISVATGGNKIQDEEDRYRTINTSVIERCNKLHIGYYNNFRSLWDWYGKWRAEFPTYQLRREYINRLFSPTFEVFEKTQETSTVEPLVKIDEWDRINRTLTKIKRDSAVAKNEEDFQTIGLLCRDLLISLAQAVYKPELHGEVDDKGVLIGETDANRMLNNYITVMLKGGSNEELRSFAKSANKLANRLTHERSATKKDMMLTISATVAVINLIGALEEKY
jgi:hypothetical protein